MSGRPVRLLAAAAIVAAASLLPVSSASAGCYSGCGYAAPVVRYAAPVVYGHSCGPCGHVSYRHVHHHRRVAPMFVVNQGPAFSAPVHWRA